VTSAKTAETFRGIDEISGRIFNQERDRDRLRKIGETFVKIGRISGKIIGTSGMIAKTGVGTGKTYGTTWLAAKATAVKHSYGQNKAGNNFGCCRLLLPRNRNYSTP
jgi:hypothetical protein